MFHQGLFSVTFGNLETFWFESSTFPLFLETNRREINTEHIFTYFLILQTDNFVVTVKKYNFFVNFGNFCGNLGTSVGTWELFELDCLSTEFPRFYASNRRKMFSARIKCWKLSTQGVKFRRFPGSHKVPKCSIFLLDH